ncbi:MAG TPA: hypothetical protein VG676_12805 [Chitinophagaceae bacterium]|nr:hypothetical protein [Chitinophagaceae bacterium]
MKKYILVLYGLILVLIASSQSCEEKAAQTPGKWIMSSYTPGYSKSDKKQTSGIESGKINMYLLMDTLTGIVKKALPQLQGFDGRITKKILSSSDVNLSYGGYELYSHYFEYYCSNDVIKKADESRTNFIISVNVLDVEDFLRKQFYFEPFGIKLYTVPIPAGRVQSFPSYQMYSYGDDPKFRADRFAVLITRDQSVLPFTPVTKGEFYPLVRNCINQERETQKKSITNNTPIRPKAELEAELKKQMDEIDKSSLGQDAKNARKRRLQQDFRTDEQLLDEKLKAVDKQYEGYLTRLDEMERVFKNELNTPVFTKEWEFTLSVLNTSYNQQHLFNDSLHGYMIVKLNPAYFKKTAEKWKPQFFLVTWRKDNSYPYSRSLDALWRTKLDFEKIRSLLVK